MSVPSQAPLLAPVPGDAQLIAEALRINHAQVEGATTRKEYGRALEHFSAFLAGRGKSFITGERDDVLLFDRHLKNAGGPDDEPCPWCAERGYPSGRKGSGYSPSYRKKHFAAINFLTAHFSFERSLPDKRWLDYVRRPRVNVERQYTPSREEVQRLLAAQGGSKREAFVCTFLYYAPTRREPLADARIGDFDLEHGLWYLNGKGDKKDVFALHPVLVAALRDWLHHVETVEAAQHPAVARQLRFPAEAPLLMTRNGRAVAPSQIEKHVKRRAIRAGVALIDGSHIRSNAVPGVPGEKVTTRMSPHALRRAWADHSLNDPDAPVPLDVVSEALNHRDITTTRRHYAGTKPERAQAAILGHRL